MVRGTDAGALLTVLVLMSVWENEGRSAGTAQTCKRASSAYLPSTGADALG